MQPAAGVERRSLTTIASEAYACTTLRACCFAADELCPNVVRISWLTAETLADDRGSPFNENKGPDV
jgi:hypothetical protein